jgi:hypothetical protein
MNRYSKTALSVAAAALFATPLSAQAGRGGPLDPDDAYKNNCTRCHAATPALPPGATRTIVMHMRVRANLTEEETAAIVEYLAGAGSTPSSREARGGRRADAREGGTDARPASTTASTAASAPEATPPTPAVRSLPPSAPPTVPSVTASERAAESITVRWSATGGPAPISRDAAAGTLTLHAKEGEHSYLLDPKAAALLDRAGPGGKAYLNWRIDEKGRPELVLLRLEPGQAEAVVLRPAPRTATTPASPVTTPPPASAPTPSGPVEAPSSTPSPSMSGATGPATLPEGRVSVGAPAATGGTPRGRAAAAATASGAATTKTSPRRRVIEVIADGDNRFKVPGESRPVIRLKAGERVTLRITSRFGGEKARDDAVHGFVVKELRGLGWDLRLYEGTRDYPLVAPAAAGEYEVECTVKCGPGHEDMKMKLVVEG